MDGRRGITRPTDQCARHASRSRRPAAFRRTVPGTIMCKVASTHSHLGDAIADMEVRRPEPAHHVHHHHKKHVFHSKSHSTTTVTVPRPHSMEKFHQAVIPHIDGQTVDPTDVLMWLREHLLLNPTGRTSAVVTAEETGVSLLDLVSIMVLLDEDVRSEEQGSVVVFQPVLDIKNKHGLHPPSFRPSNHHDSYTPVDRAPSPQPSLDPPPPGLVAALISMARCPKLFMGLPSVCIAATVRMDSAEVATVIAEAVEEHGSTRLRVANSAEGLVAAWRAVRRARAVVRGRSSGARDLLCTAHIESLDAPVLPATASGAVVASGPGGYDDDEEYLRAGSASAAHSNGNGNSQGQQPPPPQQGVMYLNVWRVR